MSAEQTPAGDATAGGGELEPAGLPVTVWLALGALLAAGVYVAVLKTRAGAELLEATQP